MPTFSFYSIGTYGAFFSTLMQGSSAFYPTGHHLPSQSSPAFGSNASLEASIFVSGNGKVHGPLSFPAGIYGGLFPVLENERSAFCSAGDPIPTIDTALVQVSALWRNGFLEARPNSRGSSIFQEGVDLLQKAASLCHEEGEPKLEMEAVCGLATAFAKKGRKAEARRELDRLVVLLNRHFRLRIENPFLYKDIALQAARAMLACVQPLGDPSLLKRAYEIYCMPGRAEVSERDRFLLREIMPQAIAWGVAQKGGATLEDALSIVDRLFLSDFSLLEARIRIALALDRIGRRERAIEVLTAVYEEAKKIEIHSERADHVQDMRRWKSDLLIEIAEAFIQVGGDEKAYGILKNDTLSLIRGIENWKDELRQSEKCVRALSLLAPDEIAQKKYGYLSLRERDMSEFDPYVPPEADAIEKRRRQKSEALSFMIAVEGMKARLGIIEGLIFLSEKENLSHELGSVHDPHEIRLQLIHQLCSAIQAFQDQGLLPLWTERVLEIAEEIREGYGTNWMWETGGRTNALAEIAVALHRQGVDVEAEIPYLYLQIQTSLYKAKGERGAGRRVRDHLLFARQWAAQIEKSEWALDILEKAILIVRHEVSGKIDPWWMADEYFEDMIHQGLVPIGLRLREPRFLHKASDLIESMQIPFRQLRSRMTIAEGFFQLGCEEDALAVIEAATAQTLPTLEEDKDCRHFQIQMANLLTGWGHSTKAIPFLRQVLEQARNSEDSLEASSLLFDLSAAFIKAGEFEEGMRLRDEAAGRLVLARMKNQDDLRIANSHRRRGLESLLGHATALIEKDVLRLRMIRPL